MAYSAKTDIIFSIKIIGFQTRLQPIAIKHLGFVRSLLCTVWRLCGVDVNAGIVVRADYASFRTIEQQIKNTKLER